MENEILERLMKVLELISEEAGELTNLRQGLGETMTQAKGQMESINKDSKAVAATINELSDGLKTIKPEMQKTVREVATKAAQEFSRTLSRERNKSAWGRFAGYLLVLALVVGGVVFFTGKYYAPLAMEQYAEMKASADRMKDLDSIFDRMTQKEKESMLKMISDVRQRSTKP
jgi:uncharacterized phage infection (PIP) family protein YhgE